MNNPPRIPPWVPRGVTRFCEFAELNNDVARRLLTDPRMEQAWKDLRSIKRPDDHEHRMATTRSELFITHYPQVIDGFSDFDFNSAYLFHQVMIETYQIQRTYWTEAEAKKLSQPFLDAAKLCANAHSFDFTLQYKVELQKSLEMVKDYFQDQARMLQMRDNPRVIGRRLPGVSDEKRGHARMIATMIRAIFNPPAGDFPHSAVGRLMAVSLDAEDDVLELKDSVRSWCKDLPPEKPASL